MYVYPTLKEAGEVGSLIIGLIVLAFVPWAYFGYSMGEYMYDINMVKYGLALFYSYIGAYYFFKINREHGLFLAIIAIIVSPWILLDYFKNFNTEHGMKSFELVTNILNWMIRTS